MPVHLREDIPDADQAAARIFAALARDGRIGICVFGRDGIVCLCQGIDAALAPGIGEDMADFPLFAGMWQAVLDLQSAGGSIDLPSIGLGQASPARFDLQVVWIKAEQVFCALFHPASQRISLEFAAAQAARDKSLLLQQIAQQQAQIVAQNALMQTFITHVPAAVAMLDADLHYQMVSQRWCADFDVDAAALLRQRFQSGLPGKARRWEQALRRPPGGTATGIEKFALPDGDVAWHRWERQKLGADGQAGTLVFAEDITEAVAQTARLRAQAARLGALNGEMRRFALAASHDLRAPLRQIAAFAQFLADDHCGDLDAEGSEFVGLIQQCALRMTGMIDALLRYARITHEENAMSVFAIAQAVEAACDNLRAEIVLRGALVACSPRVKMRGDLALVTILFQNLIDNALKYIAVDPVRITVEARAEDGGLLVSVTDNGPGIAPHLQAKAFDLFQRLGAAQAVPGAGVGLSICRKIVESHGGEMAIDPDYTGGLRYLIRLPTAPAHRGRRAPKSR